MSSFLWLLFFPNTTYVLTDLIHLRQRDFVPIWFDLVLILSYALASLYLGISSLMMMHNLVEKFWNRLSGWIFVIIVLLLSSFGVYLGRFLRWNSWDLFINPIDLINDIVSRFTNPASHPRTAGFTFLFFVLSLLVYSFFYILNAQAVYNTKREK